MVVGGGSQRLLSLNPTTVMFVLLLGLWLLLGCDISTHFENTVHLTLINVAFLGHANLFLGTAR